MPSVYSKIICVYDISVGLLVDLTLFVQKDSERSYIECFAQVKTSRPMSGVIPLKKK